MTLFTRRTIILLFSLGLSFQASGIAAPAFPLSNSVSLPDESMTWFKDGEAIEVPVSHLDQRLYLSVDQLARMSNAQLRWQSVTQQACLGNIQGLMCFNWGDSRITRDGRTVHGNHKLHFDGNQLLVPVEFVTTKDFSAFTKSAIDWNKSKMELTQNSPLSLAEPQVEKMDDRYRITIRMPTVVPHYLLEKNNDRIWIRFVRAQSDGSQIFQGDRVVKEIKVVQKRHSADLLIRPGPLALSNEVYFDADAKSVIVDVLMQPGTAAAPSEPKKLVPTRVNRPVARASKGKDLVIPVKTMTPKAVASVPSLARAAAPDRTVTTIVIDAGHGGEDSGAIGVRGTQEKNINLEAAKTLAKQLSQNKHFRVILTRSTDEFIPLHQRTQMANQAKADIFVSIHCNASLSAKGNGFEAYVLSPDSTDKAAESVARVENSVVALEAKKGAHTSKLEELLASMAVHNYINESSKCASHVCRYVKSRDINDKTYVREADFYVLRGAQMPAVLVEMEYLSNPISEMKLRSSRYRQQLAKGIAEGVTAYVRQVQKEAQARVFQNASVEEN